MCLFCPNGKLYRSGPLELVQAPKVQMAEMGQAEYLLIGVPVYLIHFDSNWYVAVELVLSVS
jgi:hypothetical protein